jgi:hypothetical protein
MRITLENFIERSNLKHSDRYDYSLIDFIGKAAEYVQIICPEHSTFRQQAKKHLAGGGCPECGKLKGGKRLYKNKEEFIVLADKKHNGKYDYTNSLYINGSTKFEIKCKVCEETFIQNPTNHLRGYGCTTCNGGIKYDTETFIKKSKERYPNLLEYPNTVYVNTSTPVKVYCKEHGEVEVRPITHLSSNVHPCLHCAKYSKPTIDYFIKESNRVHNNRYDYSLVTTLYTDNQKVPIICKEHGQFEQYHVAHMKGHGCRKCYCGGFDTEKLGNFYILGCGEYIKVGITNRCVDERLSEITRKSNYNWTVLHVYEADGAFIERLERNILNSFDFGISSDIIHTGYTEAISSEKYSEVFSLFNKLIKQKET